MSTHKEPCGACGHLAVDDDYSERCSRCGWLFHYPTCYKHHHCGEAGRADGPRIADDATAARDEADLVGSGPRRVVLDKDVAAAFPTDNAVNEALRALLGASKVMRHRS